VNGGTADGGSGNDVVFGIAEGDIVKGGSGSDFADGTLSATVQRFDCGAAYDTYALTGADTVCRCEAVGTNPNTN
jgi:hypothetical protein